MWKQEVHHFDRHVGTPPAIWKTTRRGRGALLPLKGKPCVETMLRLEQTLETARRPALKACYPPFPN